MIRRPVSNLYNLFLEAQAIISFEPASVSVQVCLCRTWSETQKVCFLIQGVGFTFTYSVHHSLCLHLPPRSLYCTHNPLGRGFSLKQNVCSGLNILCIVYNYRSPFSLSRFSSTVYPALKLITIDQAIPGSTVTTRDRTLALP